MFRSVRDFPWAQVLLAALPASACPIRGRSTACCFHGFLVLSGAMPPRTAFYQVIYCGSASSCLCWSSRLYLASFMKLDCSPSPRMRHVACVCYPRLAHLYPLLLLRRFSSAAFTLCPACDLLFLVHLVTSLFLSPPSSSPRILLPPSLSLLLVASAPTPVFSSLFCPSHPLHPTRLFMLIHPPCS